MANPTKSAMSGVAKTYIYFVNVLGCAVLAFSLWKMIGGELDWVPLALLASCGGFLSVKVPTRREAQESVTLTLSDVFIYVAILWFGTYVAIIISALDTLLGSLRIRQRGLHRVLFNFSNLAITTLIASKLFYYLYSEGRELPLGTEDLGNPRLYVSLGIASITLFLLNSGSVALAISLVTRMKLVELWKTDFLWTSLTNFAGAAAAVGSLYLGKDRVFLVLVTLPIVVVIYFSYRQSLKNVVQAKEHLVELRQLYHSTISSLAMAIDAKDQTTHGHVRRVQSFALGLQEMAGISEHDQVEGLRAASLLHDVGKLAIPEYILNKPSGFTPSEREKMKEHVIVGADILSSVNFPYPVVPTVRHHHEKWDGTGYPDKLKGKEIPISARILSIADCYDALRSDRPYRAELSREVALEYIQKEAGKSYDPELVELFARNINELEARASNAAAALPERVLKSIGDSVSGGDVVVARQKLDSTVFHDIAASHKEIQAIYELSQNMGKSLKVSETMAIIAGKMEGIVPYAACGIFLLEREGDRLNCFFATGKHSDLLEKRDFKIGESATGWVAANKQPLMDGREFQEYFKSCLSVPLSLEGQLVGVITLYSETEKYYTQDHLRLLETISRQAAIAINNSLIFEETQEDAFTDLLTGLPNSRYLYTFLEQEFRRAERMKYPVSILVMDLEGFKAVNDSYGHQTGDRVLTQVAQTLRSQMRKSDTCVRYAGDEFVGVLSGANRRQAEDNIARIQNAFDNLEINVEGLQITLGISAGCATFPDEGGDSQSLLALADQNMYADKLRRSSRPVKSPPGKVISFEGRPAV